MGTESTNDFGSVAVSGDDEEIAIGDTVGRSLTETLSDIQSIENVGEAPKKVAPTGGLTKEDVKCLLASTSITFHSDSDGSSITARQVRTDATFGKQTLEREVEVKSTLNVQLVASATIEIDVTNACWNSIAQTLRVGDELVLEWKTDTNAALRVDHNLFRDELYLTVNRFDGRGRGANRIFTYYVTDVIAVRDERPVSFL
jgi:hypothetical protein